MARHATGDGMDGELHFTAALLDEFGEFAHLVLRLRHGHAVTGDDDDELRVGELHRRVLDVDRMHRLRLCGVHDPAALVAAEGPEQDVRE